MATVSLQMIVKDEFEQADKLITYADPYFHELNITVSDKPTANKLRKIWEGNPKVNVVWREWNNRFDDARNANYALSNCDYTFWIDADDTFNFATIPEMLKVAVENDIDAIFLPYNYAQDENGNCITRHWRERLVKNDGRWQWRGWVHETLICDEKYRSHKLDNEVKHLSTKEHNEESFIRNFEILKEAYLETEDPRYLHYLGMSYFTLGEYNKCVETLLEYLKVGGSVEDAYRALCMISEASYMLKEYDMAIEYATKCATLKPEYPMAYWLLAQFEADQENWENAIEWIRVSESKPDPQTLSVWDPTSRERAALIGANAEYMLGNYNAAVRYLKKIPKNKDAISLFDDFLYEADKETFVKLLPKLSQFFNDKKSLYNSLKEELQYDVRLRDLRNAVTQPKKWDDKSIVIFCGQGYEEWGPHTLDKGMGGSEEAVVYLTAELAKLGWDVTVYAEHDGEENGVHWKFWKKIDLRDDFNVFVAWRHPSYLSKVNAKVKLADIHDVMPEETMKNDPDITYMLKSEYHKELYPELQNYKIIGNGISKEQFND